MTPWRSPCIPLLHAAYRKRFDGWNQTYCTGNGSVAVADFVSVPCVDEDVWRALEPGTAHPLKRLRAVRELVDAGIRAGVLMNPIVPGISSKPALIERTIKAIADHGARFIGCNVMYLQDGTKDHFLGWLEREYPQLVDGYRQLYASKYPPATYRAEVKRVVGALRLKYGLASREKD